MKGGRGPGEEKPRRFYYPYRGPTPSARNPEGKGGQDWAPLEPLVCFANVTDAALDKMVLTDVINTTQ